MDKIIIYADGGSRNNGKENAIGGWGVVLTYGNSKKELYGGQKNVTNNQMELIAAIKALEAIKTTDIPVEVYCDSAYVVNGMNEWIYNWVKKGWRTANKKPVENKELWMKLHELRNNQETINFIKVKGHSGVNLNELADQLANKAMDVVERCNDFWSGCDYYINTGVNKHEPIGTATSKRQCGECEHLGNCPIKMENKVWSLTEELMYFIDEQWKEMELST